MSNAQFETVSAIRKTDISKMQTAQTIKISTKDAVKKVLSCGIDSNIASYECMSGEASFFGRTNIKMLYIDEMDVLCSANYNADFTDRLIGADIVPTAQLEFDVNVVDYKTDANQNLVTVAVVLEVSASAYVNNSVTAFSGGEGMFTKYSDIELVTDAYSSNYNIEISEELIASSNINRILLAESSVAATDYSIADGVLTVSGDAFVTLVYASGDTILSDKLPFKFSQETDAKSFPSNSQLTLKANVKNTRVRLDILEEETNNSFTAEITVGLSLSSTVSQSVPIIEDAYTTVSDLEFSRSQLVTTLPCGSVTAKKSIEQTVPFGHRGDYICTTDARVTVTKCLSLEQRCLIEGIISGNILFMGDSGLDSTRVELPFAETVDIDYIMPACISYAKASVSDITVKLGANVAVSADITFNVDSSRVVSIPVISDVNETLIEFSESSAIEICLARKGETLWQLAKGLHISEQDILTINPDIKSPLEQDTKIVLYNAL